MTEYNVSDFGKAKFILEKNCVRRTMECYGTILMIEKKYVLFRDNDKYEYIIAKTDFQFAKCEFKDKS